MYAGAAVPLAVLLLVVAGVLWGVFRAAGTAPDVATNTPSATQRVTAAAGPRSASKLPLAIGGGTFTYLIAGTRYRQETLADLRSELLRAPRRTRIDGHWGAFIAELRPEPGNPHDPDAVAVDARGHGPVGWLPRGEGARYLPLLHAVRERGLPLHCPAEVCKRPDGALGVHLDLATPGTIAARLHVNLTDLVNSAPAGVIVESQDIGGGGQRTPAPATAVDIGADSASIGQDTQASEGARL